MPRNNRARNLCISTLSIALLACLLLPGLTAAQDYTDSFNREGCTFSTVGTNPYWPLWPGNVLFLEGEEEDEGETVEIAHRITTLDQTMVIDGVNTRVVEEYETEDGELVEISYNFFAICRETGDIWYFGEDVDDYEDGEIVGHGGVWRAGVDGAEPGVVMPGSPMLGARFLEEVAPGIALDTGEIAALGLTLTVPNGTYMDVLQTEEGNLLEPDSGGQKFYAPGVGVIKDEELELVGHTLPGCIPDDTTHCLNGGRFMVQSDWTDFDANEGDGQAILGSSESGEFWFFSPTNTEVLAKVLDGCAVNGYYWVFAAGLTNVEATIEVTDTATDTLKEYDNDLGVDFAPILDSKAFPCE